jgi:hypothetical protein
MQNSLLELEPVTRAGSPSCVLHSSASKPVDAIAGVSETVTKLTLFRVATSFAISMTFSSKRIFMLSSRPAELRRTPELLVSSVVTPSPSPHRSLPAEVIPIMSACRDRRLNESAVNPTPQSVGGDAGALADRLGRCRP